MSLLRLDHVSAFYGASQALFDVSLAVAPGEVVALMGRNGMGKSTTVKVICRLLHNSGGTVLFDGADLAGLPAHRAARAGIGLVPEGLAPVIRQEIWSAIARRRAEAGLSILVIDKSLAQLRQLADRAVHRLVGGAGRTQPGAGRNLPRGLTRPGGNQEKLLALTLLQGVSA